MPRKANFIFEVRIRIAEAFTLDSIVRSPRTFKPKDVLSACQNNELVLKSGQPPQPVVDLATYVMTDFFAMAHATGLYNRQRTLWEALSKVNAIHVFQLSSGLFKKAALPVFDFSFLDYKDKPLVAARLISQLPERQSALALTRAFIGHLQGKPSLTGVLCCFPEHVPEDVLGYAQKATASSDAIGRYESILPQLRVPLDLLSMNSQNLTQLSCESEDKQELRTVFRLFHPDINTRNPIEHPKAMRMVMPRPKDEQSEEAESESMPHQANGSSAD